MGIKDHIPQIFVISRPQSSVALPLIFDSPHSGRIYPDDFDAACPFDTLQKAEDNEVDLLFRAVPEYGGTLLSALFPRTYIDVNRADDDIDPHLLSEPWPETANPTARSHAGIGLIRRLVRPGLPVYDRALSVAEIRHRLDHYYHPYHAALKSLLDDAHYRFGQVWHVNCHSMPSSTAKVPPGILALQPDFVLGDRDGTSCNPDFTNTLRDILRDQGYRVAINHPYKGVELVRRSADPARGRHSIQIEINKALYWDEQKNRRNAGLNGLQASLEKITGALSVWAKDNLTSIAAD